MEAFKTNLVGTDGLINGSVTENTASHTNPHYTFSAIDGSLTIKIYKDDDGRWKRSGGTEPYLSGWTDELGDQIDQHNSPAF